MRKFTASWQTNWTRKLNKYVPVLAVVVVFGGLGTWLLVGSHAATPTVNLEGESGTVSSAASTISDSTASGHGAVKFGSGSVGGSTSTCAPYPSFPDAGCTGPSGTLTTYTGSTTFSTAGQVIQNVLINTSSGITVAADNVTFKNCKIVYTGSTGGTDIVLLSSSAIGTTFDHCEIDGQSKAERGIYANNDAADVMVQNCNIHHTGNGIEMGGAITMKESYMHDIFTPSGEDWHADGVQLGDSASNITLDHNVILLTGDETGSINIVSNGGTGTFSNVLVQHNLMGGGSYTVYAGSSKAKTINFSVINNHFTTRYFPKVGQYNIWYPTYLSGVTISGNVMDETGAAANDNL